MPSVDGAGYVVDGAHPALGIHTLLFSPVAIVEFDHVYCTECPTDSVLFCTTTRLTLWYLSVVRVVATAQQSL